MATLAPFPTLARTQARTATFSRVTLVAVSPLGYLVAQMALLARPMTSLILARSGFEYGKTSIELNGRQSYVIISP
jgi:hypothetical protein